MHVVLIPVRGDELAEEYQVEPTASEQQALALAAEHQGARVLTTDQLEKFLELGPDYLATL